ncbi:MAG: squalene synthase HpnC [Alphaproteobacteria bacterium]
MSNQTAETPSGKAADDENFPVGSFLLPKPLRPHIALFYAFARAIDDVADNPDLSPEDKCARLDGFAAAIRGETQDAAYAKAVVLRPSLLKTGADPQHCLDLISAFKQDAVKTRYEDWNELIDYCNRSAAPVGRYLLDIHGEDRSLYRYADALSNALQVINHLQDCADDFAELDRVYLPADWMRQASVDVSALAAPTCSPALRQVLDRVLEGAGMLMQDARRLPGPLVSRRLAAESAMIVRIADKLIGRLSDEDPIATRVELSKPAYIACGAAGLFDVLLRRR